MFRSSAATLIVVALLGLAAAGQSGRQATPAAGSGAERPDYLTFARGAVPIAIEGAGAKLGADFEHAVRITDGNPTAFTFVSRAPAEAATDFIYELPAPTLFDRFAVPGIVETPSPTTTFTKTVEVHGSAEGATTGFALLASATLRTHKTRGDVTEIPIARTMAVRWVKLRLIGGIDVQRPTSFFEFSEIIGNGRQEAPHPVTHFTGQWRMRALTMALTQQGPVVAGCYDRGGDLTGTVSGNLLRATGIDRFDKTPSAFLLSVAPDGSLRGVRSSNNGPFRFYRLDRAAPGTAMACATPAAPTVGCGAIIHGITFAFDSAEIRPDSMPILAALYDGLRADAARTIVIEGHTSSEGADDYNLRLSTRRAEAVVGELASRGIPRERLRAAGIGERRPIASNNDESGRSLNRRVEVKCQ